MKNQLIQTKTVKFLLFSVAFGIFFSAFVSTTKAQTLTFAQFQQNDATNDFLFTNNAPAVSGTFGTVSGGSSVSFRYLGISGLDASLVGFQNAHLSIASNTTTTATLNGSSFTQPLNQTVTISVIRDAAAPVGVGSGTRRNLLTATITTGSAVPAITGSAGAGGFNVSTPSQVVTFTSDFLSFAATTNRDLGLTFSSVTPNFAIGTNNFLRTFAASAVGTFASNPRPVVAAPPPTAATVSLGGRVITPTGRGLRGARVTIIGANGDWRTVMTGAFGHYYIPDVEAGQTVILSVDSKRYSYAPQVLSVTESLNGVNFIAQ